jgi:hypothetical protein
VDITTWEKDSPAIKSSPMSDKINYFFAKEGNYLKSESASRRSSLDKNVSSNQIIAADRLFFATEVN